jgi:Peptidase family M28
VKPRSPALRVLSITAGAFGCAIVAATVYCIRMPGESRRGPLPPQSAAELEVAVELKEHVRALSVEIGERRATAGTSLARAEAYLHAQLAPLGSAPGASLRREPIPSSPGDAANLVLDLPGKRGGPWVIVGAHYDSAPGGTPAANDNGSGSAAALVLAARLVHLPHELPLRFVFFANEELPYFTTPMMGSLVHARACRARGESVSAMFSLETMGYFSDAPGSQKYPAPLSALYPDVGNFIGFVGNLGSRALLHRALGSFRKHASVPSEGAALPERLPGVGWSDHWAFWQAGYPAIMITDTALFRDPNYHLGSDTIDKLDFARLSRVVVGLERMLLELTR